VVDVGAFGEWHVGHEPWWAITFHDGELGGDADAGAHVDAVGAAPDHFQDFGRVCPALLEDACGGEQGVWFAVPAVDDLLTDFHDRV
jgi:hypothetical protein